jgi:serine/threonine-protein kinase SRPK3
LKSARAFPLFESFMGSDVDILKQTVEMLGRLPDIPGWDAFEQRALWFGEEGQPKSEQDQESAGALLKAYRTLHLEIGEQDDLPSEDEGPMMEHPRVRLARGRKWICWWIFYRKCLKYIPEERIRMQHVIRHPWFAFSSILVCSLLFTVFHLFIFARYLCYMK